VTVYTPNPKLYVSDEQYVNTRELTNYTEYDFSISYGSNDYINAPLPTTTTIKLFYTDETIPDVSTGDYIEIWSTGTIFQGYVTTVSNRYAAWGTAGYIIEWEIQAFSFQSKVQQMTWYNPTVYTGTTNQCLDRVISYGGHATWGAVEQSLTWDNVPADVDWLSYDASPMSTHATVNGTNAQSQTLDVGWRNVWDDIVTLTSGAWGLIKSDDDNITMYLDPSAMSTYGVANNELMTTIEASDNIGDTRNTVTLTKYDNTSKTYTDDDSIRQYGQQTGSLSTFINNDADLDTTGAKIINGLAWPLFGTRRASVNLYNPNVTDTEALSLMRPAGKKWSVAAPAPMGGTQTFICVGFTISANKNAWIVDLDLTPYQQAVNSINWKQVPASYTWTSYGTAYPTQKWSDL
jgi:hypothetical protein